jgi:hypothetical protein
MKAKNGFSKIVCSVTEMAKRLELSRARFYQLIQAGVLPPPTYDLRTKRPFYPVDLQEKCLEVRQTGLGMNGQYVLFYAPRKSPQNGSGKKKSKKLTNHPDLVETLNLMGLQVTGEQVEEAIRTLYPQGTDGQDQGVVIREVFRFLKKGVAD